MKKKILFIINPISGGKDKTIFPKKVQKYLDHTIFESQLITTHGPGHAREVAQEAIKRGVQIIVAVGGDGTINEVASAIFGTGNIMGIIPSGSGNGLARSLGIPLNLKKAIERINKENVKIIDCGDLNGRKFFNMAGLGFDAHISDRFAKDSTRGFFGYVRTSFSEIIKYKSHRYHIEIDGAVYERDAFMVSFANSPQFGNNAYISPKASLVDGLLDVCIISPFPLSHFLVMGYHMFFKTAEKSRYVEIIRGKKITIRRKDDGPVHVDGEPINVGNELNIYLDPLKLKVLA